jgi:hypothetical protein
MNVSVTSATGFASLAAALFAALLCGSCTGAFAQAAGTDYTNGLPSVQRVKSQIQGTDPTDTIARQVAVFEYLQVYIERIKLTRDYKGPYSPAEQKLRTEYAQAQYDLTQSFTKTHTPQEVSAFNQKEGQYSINNALEWIKQLQGSQAADAYKGAEASLNASQQRNNARIQADLSPTTPSGGGGAGGSGNLDPSQKRCLELGGSYNQCAGAMMGLLNGMASLLTMGASDSTSNEPPPLNGVLLVNAYHSRTDLPELVLDWDGKAKLSKCGSLVDDSHTYTIRKSNGSTQIVVDNEPDPIVLTLRADGSLAGPGSVQVKGNIIVGYHNAYSCQNGNCTTSSTPVYQPKLDRCTLSLLAQQPPPPPPPPQQQQTGLMAMFGDLTAPGPPTTLGFRVTGDYASSLGMQLSFANGTVTLDCGRAHVNAPYTVDNTTTGLIIHVQNGAGPFLLGVAPDNTLRGSGTTTVNGKLVSSVNGENVSFAPHSESCPVGTFTPKGKRNTMLASNAPMTAVPSYSAPAPTAAPPPPAAAPVSPAAKSAAAPTPIETSLAGAGISRSGDSRSGDVRAQFRVLLSSSFAGTNPLVGQTVFVSRKPMDQILRELGVAVPANATPAQAMQALQTQCHSSQGCSSAIKGLSAYYVTTTKLDSTGKATLSATAATGRYYFFAIVPSGSGSTVWDVLANLAAGDNTVSFTAANGEQIR